MKKRNLFCKKSLLFKSVLGLSAGFASTALLAASLPFSVTATADNDFLIVHSQGSSHQVVYRSQDGSDWKKAQQADFKIKTDTLKGCSIDIIAWNDHSVAEGLAAVVRGNTAEVHSGDSLMVSYATKIPNQGNWANNNYPSNSQVNTIMNALIPSATHVHGVVGSTQPWGNAVVGLSAPTQWIWAVDARMGQEFGRNFTVYRTACDKVAKLPQVKKGMTWRKIGVDPITGVVNVGCGYVNGQNECNPHHGDTMCNVARPILCKRKLGLPKPQSVDIPSKYHRWSGNLVATTKPVAPASEGLATLGDANRYCEKEFNPGADPNSTPVWKVATFHDGWAWNFKAYGNIGTNVENGRFWVNIGDQANGNCWSQ